MAAAELFPLSVTHETHGRHDSGDTLRKGMLIKINNDLFRVLEVQHVTPGNLRGFVRVEVPQHPERDALG